MNAFQASFDRPPSVIARAPGRVNLIGEHTDYNGGFVLPTAIPQHTRVELAPRSDDEVRLVSANMDDTVQRYRLGGETRGRGWVDYIQGVTRALANDGNVLTGFEARIASNVPLGSGVSSSASLAVAVLRALREAFQLPLDDLALALIAQRAENELVGAPVGVMDPMACSLCVEGAALFVDTRDLSFELIPIPTRGAVVVISSGIVHSHATGEYAVRRRECEAAARALEVRSLRELTLRDLGRIGALPEPLGRRAWHVVTENDRVEQAVAALGAGDLETLGRLFTESHRSMRDDFAVSVPPIDDLVHLAEGTPGVFGARLTGGGFGGSVVILTSADRAHDVARSVAKAYSASHPIPAQVLVPALGGTP